MQSMRSEGRLAEFESLGIMNSLVSLILRILMGERYKAPSERDTRLWLSVLASLPFLVVIAALLVLWISEASTFSLWIGLVVTGVVAVGGVRSIYLIRRRWIRL